MAGRSLYEKILDNHTVRRISDSEVLMYVDLHLLHEVTSPQAFSGLERRGIRVRRPELCLAVAEHNTPTENQELGLDALTDPEARSMLSLLYDNAAVSNIELIPMGDARNGIVHVVGPEQGRTRSGMTIVCGDSHTSTHGAFGALAHGIGTSEVEHVLATQTLRTRRMKNMAVRVSGKFGPHCGAKDLALYLIARIGTGAGAGCVIEFQGETITALSMEERMTLCNMAIEAGARAGLIAPDDVTARYLSGRGSAATEDEDGWRHLFSDEDTDWHRVVEINASEIEPMTSWGTSPEQSAAITGRVPDPATMPNAVKRAAAERAIDYMGLTPGQKLCGIPIQRVFIGSCTNSRIEDLRAVAAVARTGHVADGVRAMIVPGSNQVRAQAEAEALNDVFLGSGFEWRQPGCSMCLAMNPDRLAPGERCASTSNRNFEGRQGRGGRTHLMSPAMAARAALAGTICSP